MMKFRSCAVVCTGTSPFTITRGFISRSATGPHGDLRDAGVSGSHAIPAKPFTGWASWNQATFISARAIGKSEGSDGPDRAVGNHDVGPSRTPAPRLPARGHHREHRPHEPSPRRALRTPAVPTPDHRVSPGTLRCVEIRGGDLTACRSWDPVGPGGSGIPDYLAIHVPMTADDAVMKPSCATRRREGSLLPVVVSA